MHQRLKFCDSMRQIGINAFIDDMWFLFILIDRHTSWYFFYLSLFLHLCLNILVLLVSSRVQLILAIANTSMFGCMGKWKICLWKSNFHLLHRPQWVLCVVSLKWARENTWLWKYWLVMYTTEYKDISIWSLQRISQKRKNQNKVIWITVIKFVWILSFFTSVNIMRK